jgi:hypothetical protein
VAEQGTLFATDDSEERPGNCKGVDMPVRGEARG